MAVTVKHTTYHFLHNINYVVYSLHKSEHIFHSPVCLWMWAKCSTERPDSLMSVKSTFVDWYTRKQPDWSLLALIDPVSSAWLENSLVCSWFIRDSPIKLLSERIWKKCYHTHRWTESFAWNQLVCMSLVYSPVMQTSWFQKFHFHSNIFQILCSLPVVWVQWTSPKFIGEECQCHKLYFS